MEHSFTGGNKVLIINTSWFTSQASLAVLLNALTQHSCFAQVPGEVEAFEVKKDSIKKCKSRAYSGLLYLCYFPRGTPAFEKSNNSSFYFSRQSFNSVNTLVLLVMPQASG